MKQINIFCGSTKYHILLSALLAVEFKNDINILVAEMTGFTGSDLLKAEYENNIFDKVILLRDDELALKNKFGYLCYKHSITKIMETKAPELKKLRKLNMIQDNIRCFTCEDGHQFSRYFIYKFRNVIMLEDGMQIYKDHIRREKVLVNFLKFHILGIIKPNGRDRRIEEIWVQYPDRLPSEIRHKGRSLNLKRLLDEMYASPYLLTLQKMLGFSQGTIEKTKEAFDNSCENILLLITQPLSEDGLISEEEKLKIYRAILAEQSSLFCLIIKPHPREKTDYSEVFSDAIILDNGFPLELLRFVVDKDKRIIDCAITVDSTAAMNIQEICRKIKVYGLCNITAELNKKYPLKKGYEAFI